MIITYYWRLHGSVTFPRYEVDRDFKFLNRECAVFVLPASQVERWAFRRSFSVFAQYFRRVLKKVWKTNKLENRQFVMCLFCKHWKEIFGLPLGELEGNRENLPSFFVKSCFFKIRWNVSVKVKKNWQK